MRRCAIFAVLLLACIGLAQSHAKRLILKDGSYQAITEYKVEGDRVHYYSAERFDWEDLPNSLIDWDATNKYNASPMKADDAIRVKRSPDADEAAEETKSESQEPTVAAHLRLPDASVGGVYLLDQFKDAPELVEIIQNGADAGDLTRGESVKAALGGVRKSIKLPQAHARVQAHGAMPTLYLAVETGEKGVGLSEHYRIAKVQSDVPKNIRTVGNLLVKGGGKSSEEEKFVPSSAELVNGGPWVKLTPSQPLAPGEYAVVEMLGPTEMNLFVWDFGVNPAAAENTNAVKGTP